MIYIHKNDSTVFADQEKFLTFNIKTDYDLTGWKAEFCLCSVKKIIDNISNKSVEVILTAKDTSKLWIGKPCGELRLIDAKGNIKTIANKIPFCVTTDIVENEAQTIDLDIPESAEISVCVSYQSAAGTSNYEALENIPSINGVELLGDKSLDELGIQPKGDYLTEHQDISNLATKTELTKGLETKQPKGDYLTEHQDISGKQDKLVAGENITIEGNVISAIGGSSGVDFELTAPLQYVYDGNIGSAYLYNSTDENEITTNEVIGKSVQLLKSGSATTGEYSNFEPNKAWEISVKEIVLNSLPSAYTRLLDIRRFNSGAAIININESNQLAFYCNFGTATSTSATGISLAVDTPYDLKISYDGAGKTTLQYKLSSSPTWITGATRSSTLTANSGTGYNYVAIGNEYTSFMLSNVEFISNGNVLFKHVEKSTKYLTADTYSKAEIDAMFAEIRSLIS